ncbi:hypothetical protein CYMTET_16059 [Cymbomonas tetramitiformis]|uniref:BZIP domain-containing protein n=1 Tax=Cymbomonas tetramitiformis TaxID=36881 RepID=A0AAE0GDB7_9CHLO|nr:hypothetical protein CYMTET_16059 [Cymbomonas tetramitiformis]
MADQSIGEACQDDLRKAQSKPETSGDKDELGDDDDDQYVNDRDVGQVRIRNSSLREQNSRAQKRYRERQKVQKVQLESELSALRQQALELQDAERKKQQTKARIETLKHKLKENEVTISVLRAQTTSQLSRAKGEGRLEANSFEGAVSDDVVKAFTSHLSRMNEKTITGLTFTANEREEILLDTKNLCNLLQSGDQGGPLWLKSLLIADLSLPTVLEKELQLQFWKKVSDSIRLSPTQVQQLRQSGSDLLQRLDTLYLYRRMLCGQLESLCTVLQTLVGQFISQSSQDTAEISICIQKSGVEGLTVLGALQDNFSSEAQLIEAFHTNSAKFLDDDQRTRFRCALSLKQDDEQSGSCRISLGSETNNHQLFATSSCAPFATGRDVSSIAKLNLGSSAGILASGQHLLLQSMFLAT